MDTCSKGTNNTPAGTGSPTPSRVTIGEPGSGRTGPSATPIGPG